MKTLSPNGMKILKITHIVCSTMWIGGVMALVCIMLGSKPFSQEMIYMAAKDHLVIDIWFLIPGGVGIVITALLYSIFTKWGFVKHRWVAIKWILTIILVIIGKLYMGIIIEKNMAYAERIMTEGITSEPFYTNVTNVAIAGIIQLVLFAVVLILSVVKPKKKEK